MRKVIERCPACGGDLTVTHLQCGRCDTEISGRFTPNPFDRLSPESLAFVEVFVRLRGNVKEMERELKIPYSTVRGRLDEVIRELGFEVTPDRSISERDDGADAERDRRREVLRHLEEGSIDADAAIEQLESLKHHDSLTKRKKGKV